MKISEIQHVAPADIEARSMEIIESEVPEPRPFHGGEWRIVRRMIHTTADFELLNLVRFHPDAVAAGRAVLEKGGLIVTDTEMARMGIPMRRMDPLGCTVRCLMNDERVIAKAKEENTTRAKAAVDVAAAEQAPDIWVIGNAPTALIRLVELMERGKTAPALVIGMPVGFVNAAESKELLLEQTRVPYVTIRGRKGGSALAATVVNALADMVAASKSTAS